MIKTMRFISNKSYITAVSRFDYQIKLLACQRFDIHTSCSLLYAEIIEDKYFNQNLREEKKDY